MDLSRRRFTKLLGGIGASAGLVPLARAQSYPSHEVRVLVGFPLGGPLDVAARGIAPSLSAQFGQPFAVQDHPGASGNAATGEVVRAAPDGYDKCAGITPGCPDRGGIGPCHERRGYALQRSCC